MMNTKYNKLILSLSILCSIALFIEIVIFYKMGMYVDKYDVSVPTIFGGHFWLYMDWLKLFALFGATVISWTKFFKK